MSDEGEDLFINAADFTGLGLSITCKEWPSAEIQLIEFLPNGFSLEVPADRCSRGKELELRFEIPTEAEVTLLAVIKKIDRHEVLHYGADKIEHSQSARESLVLEIRQVLAGEWSAIEERFRTRQAEIQNFFSRVRGY